MYIGGFRVFVQKITIFVMRNINVKGNRKAAYNTSVLVCDNNPRRDALSLERRNGPSPELNKTTVGDQYPLNGVWTTHNRPINGPLLAQTYQ